MSSTKHERTEEVTIRPITEEGVPGPVELLIVGHDVSQATFELEAEIQYELSVGPISREWAHYVPHPEWGKRLVTSSERRRGAQAVTIAAVIGDDT